jgi:fructose-1-phosphate kinase PfkB-like protein
MNRPANRPANRSDLVVRAFAALCAVGITSLIIGVHAADQSVLGGQEVTVASNPTVVAASSVGSRGSR